MKATQRPLPDWLTRLLDADAERAFAPTPGERSRRDARPAPRRDEEALDGAILKGIVLAGSVLVWAAILWLTLRHFLR